MRSLLFIFLFISVNSFSQDTIRAFFDFGSTKMNLRVRTDLTGIDEKYNMDDVDSIQFIGYADSVGKIENNLKLSLKRAKAVYKQCRGFMEKDLHYSILARGEGRSGEASLNRRVEVVLHYSPEEIETPEIVRQEENTKCFFIDFEALELCNVRTISKKKKDYAYIEAVYTNYFKEADHYYLKINRDGSTEIKRLKWKKKNTGSMWWRKTRYVAEMPQASFERMQFFTMADAPCDGCKESVFTEDTIIKKVVIAYPDVFLMDNAQIKLKLFGKKRLQIRVPREYVDITEQYYVSPDITDKSRDRSITWETKKRKKQRHYYFVKIEFDHAQYPYIKKHGTTTECRNSYQNITSGSTIRRSWRNWCGTWGNSGSSRFRGDLMFDVHPGVFYQNDTVSGFLGIGASYVHGDHWISAHAGINTHLGLYLSGKYEYHFMEFPIAALNPVQGWKSGMLGSNYFWYGTFFGGAEVKSITKLKYFSFVEPNLNLGLAFNRYKDNGFLPAFYVKTGIARDVLNRVNNNFYPFVELGITFHFFDD